MTHRGAELPGVPVGCFSCGALVPQTAGPTHRYMESSPGCWSVYGEVLVREYTDALYASLHRLTVDAYAVQHPGRPSPQSIQSVAVHLISLCLILDRGGAPAARARVGGIGVARVGDASRDRSAMAAASNPGHRAPASAVTPGAGWRGAAGVRRE